MSFTSDIIVSFDPGETTGYCKCIATLEPEKLVSYMDHGEIHMANPDLAFTVLELIKDAKAVVIERSVLHGQLNRNKVNQITITEKINTIIDVCNMLREQKEIEVFWIHPESKRLSKEVPEQVKGGHARDAYKLLDACLELTRSGRF